MSFRPATITPNDSDYVSGYPSIRGGPFDAGVKSSVTSLYGPRAPIQTPNGITGNYHYGVDNTTGRTDTRLLALADGEVVYSIAGDPAVGNWLRAKTEDGHTWEYYHMAQPSVMASGQVIKAGDFVGIMGTTGLSTGVHLHLGITERGAFIDPLLFLSDGTVVVNSLDGTFLSPPVFSSFNGPQVALATFGGGTVYQLEQATKAAGGTGAWVQDWTGVFRLLIVDGPANLEDEFKLAFPRGITTATAVYLVRS